MRVPSECYQLEAELAIWVWGTIAAGSACQAAVACALTPLFATHHAARQYLREWLYAGADRAKACATTLPVEDCFVCVLRWVVRLWRGTNLPLAIDVTARADRVVVLTVAVLYRGCAIPVAWRVLPANRPGAWTAPLVSLLALLAPAVPPDWTVLVLTDRGLWSPAIWRKIRAIGWHPVMRTRPTTLCAPLGRKRQYARDLIPGPGHAWVGRATVFRDSDKRLQGTLVVYWEEEQIEPWIVVSDLPPDQIGVVWYGLRVWVELGFRTLKRFGWHWERTQRTDPHRVACHWLVMAVATVWTLIAGTRDEDAERLGRAPANLHVCPATCPSPSKRTFSVFARGLLWMRWQLLRQRRLWTCRWLLPERWPDPPPNVRIIVHQEPSI